LTGGLATATLPALLGSAALLRPAWSPAAALFGVGDCEEGTHGGNRRQRAKKRSA
jgi:hypothetical protein